MKVRYGLIGYIRSHFKVILIVNEQPSHDFYQFFMPSLNVALLLIDWTNFDEINVYILLRGYSNGI